MITIDQILCPVDFSDASRRALTHADALAHWFDARLTIFHVYLNLPVFAAVPALGMRGLDRAEPLPTSDEYRDEVVGQMRSLLPGLTSTINFRLKSQGGSDIREEILQASRELAADLVVMGSHGHTGFDRLLLGSVAEKVLRKAPCPVMIVPPHAGTPGTDIPFKEIVCALDFSPGSRRALAFALALAQEDDARLTLVHAIEVPPDIAGFTADGGSGLLAAAESEAVDRLRELVPDDARDYCTIETRIVEGRASHEILRVAAERHADVIAIGVQGRNAVDMAMFGSTTHQVLLGACCPVLTVRA